MAKRTVKQNSPMQDALRSASMDLDQLVARVDQILAEELYWLPVRHHSPAIARQVGAVFATAGRRWYSSKARTKPRR